VVDRRREGAQANLAGGQRLLRDLFDGKNPGRTGPPHHHRARLGAHVGQHARSVSSVNRGRVGLEHPLQPAHPTGATF
jgi:hypothetical protein